MHPLASAKVKIPPPSRGHIVITGASTGIGRACALQLAWNGFTVWAGIRTAAEANALEHAALGTPIPIRTIPLDVTDIESVRTAVDTIRSAVGNEGLRGLVNNAGVCVVGPVECIPLDDWRYQFEVNLLGAIAVTQVMLPLLRVHAARRVPPGARIINMGSISGDISTPVFGAYSASKFALRAMTDALRLELRRDGIPVSLIVPGTIQSDILAKREGRDGGDGGRLPRAPALRVADRHRGRKRLSARGSRAPCGTSRGSRRAMPHEPQSTNSVSGGMGG